MTKKEFMKKLEGKLSKIPENEKKDALNFYEDYFADAAIDDDMLVPESMGTPEEIAEQIIQEVVQKEQSKEYFDENVDVKSENNEYVPYYRRGESHSSANQQADFAGNEKQGTGNNKNDDSKIIAILLLVITVPIWGSIVLTVLSCIFAIIVSLGAVVFGLGVSGIALIVTSFLTGTFAAGLLLAGIGCILLAIAIIMIIPLVLFCTRFLPWFFTGIVKLCKKIFGNRREQVS